MKRVLTWLLFLPFSVVFLAVSYLILKSTFQYWSFETDIGFLAPKQRYVENWLFMGGFYIHIATAPVVAFLGWIQLVKFVRERWPGIHRALGKAYVAAVLLLAAPAGLAMAPFANGGAPGKACFVLLALAWWLATAVAWRKIRQGDIESHRRWMIRSFVLTSAAIQLRILLFVSAVWFARTGPVAYAWCAWLSWVPAVLITEILLRLIPQRSASRSRISTPAQ